MEQPPDGLPAEMTDQAARAFVSLCAHGQLRGCIGTTGPTTESVAWEISRTLSLPVPDHPGSLILSVGSFGCNLRCLFCQNHVISMPRETEVETVELSPEALAQWLATVDWNTPLHLSRFFPRYRMTDKPPTPVERAYQLVDAAREHLSFVYTRNC